jgi:hypothetical protein
MDADALGMFKESSHESCQIVGTGMFPTSNNLDVHTGNGPVAAFFDHTLITRFESVGVIGEKRQVRIHLKSVSYDWFGRAQVDRNGFDSR